MSKGTRSVPTGLAATRQKFRDQRVVAVVDFVDVVVGVVGGLAVVGLDTEGQVATAVHGDEAVD